MSRKAPYDWTALTVPSTDDPISRLANGVPGLLDLDFFAIEALAGRSVLCASSPSAMPSIAETSAGTSAGASDMRREVVAQAGHPQKAPQGDFATVLTGTEVWQRPKGAVGAKAVKKRVKGIQGREL